MPVPKSKLLGIVVAEILQAGCPSCHPTNSIKAGLGVFAMAKSIFAITVEKPVITGNNRQ